MEVEFGKVSLYRFVDDTRQKSQLEFSWIRD